MKSRPLLAALGAALLVVSLGAAPRFDQKHEQAILKRAKDLIIKKQYGKAQKLLEDDMDGPVGVTAQKSMLAGVAAIGANDPEAAYGHFRVAVQWDGKVRPGVVKFLDDLLRGTRAKTLGGVTLKPDQGYSPGPQGERFELARQIFELDAKFAGKSDAVCFALTEAKRMTVTDFRTRFPKSAYLTYLRN